MKTIIGCLILVAVVIFNSCSNIPLSYNRSITDYNLIGNWQANDSTTLVFTKNYDNSIIFSDYVVKSNYRYGTYYSRDNENKKVYFTDLVIENRLFHFLSIADNDSTYVNCAFAVDERDRDKMIFCKLDESLKATGDKTYFENTDELKNYIARNIHNDNLMVKANLYYRKDKESDFNNLITQNQPSLKSDDNTALAGLLILGLLFGGGGSNSNSTGEVKYRTCSCCSGSGISRSYFVNPGGNCTCCNGSGKVVDK